MKKNLADILENADPSDLEGLFDTVGSVNSKTDKITKKVIRKKAEGNGERLTGRSVIMPVAAALAIALIAAVFIPSLVRQDTPAPEDSITAESHAAGTSEATDANGTDERGGEITDDGQTTNEGSDKIGIDTTHSLGALTHRGDYSSIIWSEDDGDTLSATLEGAETVKWNGITVTERFYEILQSSDDGALFAVAVKTTTPNLSFRDYIYSYCPEYAEEYEERDLNAAKWIYLQDWLSLALDLRNKTGAENMKNYLAEWFGEDFVNTYYHDGNYDYDLMETDIKRYERLVNDIGQNTLSEPYSAYNRQVNPDARTAAFIAGDAEYYEHFTTNKYVFFTVLTKAELAGLYAKAEEQGDLSKFDFEHSCFTMIKASGTDMEPALKDAESRPYTPIKIGGYCIVNGTDMIDR